MRAGWPERDLERLGRCPVCEATGRELLYTGLTDRTFGCAPGTWSLHRCAQCRSAYLDPRPTEDTIALAYGDYYTHADPPPPPRVRLGPLRLALANGYLNARYGTRLAPASRLGARLAPLFPLRRARTDRLVRHLVRPRERPALLDVGCGNGAFLAQMEQAGWRAVGLDPDPRAVETCRRAGLTVVEGTLATLDAAPASFDAVTLAHVLEHLHLPREALAKARKLLRPGGTLWVATPNLASAGHARFGRDWLGLDPPRHLVVFTAEALGRVLLEARFRVVARPAACFAASTYATSARLAGDGRLAASARVRARLADALALVRPERGEELVVVATPEGHGGSGSAANGGDPSGPDAQSASP